MSTETEESAERFAAWRSDPDLSQAYREARRWTEGSDELALLPNQSAPTYALTAKDRLNEVFIFQQAIERETYEEQVARLNEEIAVTQLELHDARLGELDVEAVLAFARHLVLNASRMWSEASLDQQQRLQVVLFPEGLRYADGGFGTAVTCPIFSGLGPVSEVVNGVVAHTGFEPVLPA